MAAARRHGMPLSMMIIDVDHFKRINDEFGHAAGDQALVETVRRIRDSLRAEDLVGRLGGEEFVAVLPNTDGQSALAAAERTRAAFARAPMPVGSGEPLVTVPVGVAVLAPGGASQSAPSGVDRCHKLGPEPRQARAGVSWPGGPPVAALSPCLPLPPPPPAAAAARA